MKKRIQIKLADVVTATMAISSVLFAVCLY